MQQEEVKTETRQRGDLDGVALHVLPKISGLAEAGAALLAGVPVRTLLSHLLINARISDLVLQLGTTKAPTEQRQISHRSHPG